MPTACAVCVALDAMPRPDAVGVDFKFSRGVKRSQERRRVVLAQVSTDDACLLLRWPDDPLDGGSVLVRLMATSGLAKVGVSVAALGAWLRAEFGTDCRDCREQSARASRVAQTAELKGRSDIAGTLRNGGARGVWRAALEMETLPKPPLTELAWQA
eukprot:gene44220-901_t